MGRAGVCRRRFYVAPLECVRCVWHSPTHVMCAQRVNEKKTVFFNVRLEPSLHRELTRLAEQNDRTVAAEMRVAIRRYLAEEKAAA
jgi:hypothetical protein